LFGTYKIGDRWLIDGGVSDPLPIDVAIREGFDLIIAMGFESGYYNQISSLTNSLLHMTSVSINNLTRAQFAFYNAVHHSEIVPIMMRFDRPIELFDTHRIPYIIEEGEKSARENLPYIQRLLEDSRQPKPPS
jgi:NTE family protein